MLVQWFIRFMDTARTLTTSDSLPRCLDGGFAPKKAVLYNFYGSLSVVLGAVFTLILSQIAESSLVFLLPIAAGGFIYIATTDMMPALHEHSTLRHLFGQTTILAAGIGFMQAIVVFEQLLLP